MSVSDLAQTLRSKAQAKNLSDMVLEDVTELYGHPPFNYFCGCD